MAYAIECLLGEREPVSGVRDARTNLSVCLAVYRSARTGRVVEVPDLA
jgi:hypothetical protein